VRRDEGRNLSEETKALKKLSVGAIFNLGICRIGKTAFNIVKDNVTHKTNEVQARASKAYNVHLKNIEAAAEVRASGKPYAQLNNVQLKALIVTLKWKGDPAIPSRKAELITTLVSWEGRTEVVMQAPSFNALQVLVLQEEAEDDEYQDGLIQEDCI